VAHAGVVVAIGCFLVVDVAFFAANLLKLTEGGWFPLVIGGAAFFLLMTWYSGRMLLHAHQG
jgi:KUP system potassium uptake protein